MGPRYPCRAASELTASVPEEASMIHLDTGFLIHALVSSSGPDRRLRTWLRDGEHLAISSIAWAEFLCGPIDANELAAVTTMLHEIEAFTAADCETTARLFNLGGRRRGTMADCMIAAVAIRAGATLATTNPIDFERFASDSLTIVTA
jgi:predicted nucleic acid-binding protein